MSQGRNGRTAWALFYASMLRPGHGLAGYLSISRILRAAPAKYARACVYAERDNSDLSYFVGDQPQILLQALDDLRAYRARHARAVHGIEDVLQGSPCTAR